MIGITGKMYSMINSSAVVGGLLAPLPGTLIHTALHRIKTNSINSIQREIKIINNITTKSVTCYYWARFDILSTMPSDA